MMMEQLVVWLLVIQTGLSLVERMSSTLGVTFLVNRNLDLMRLIMIQMHFIRLFGIPSGSLVGETCDATGSWYVLDNKRDTNNRVYRSVNLNSSNGG